MTPSPAQLGRKSVSADVAVIGGGIVGSACAWRLAERGLKVAVLEAAPELGAGSSGRSGAGVRVQWSEEVNVRLSWESIQEYRTFGERYGAASGYRPNGYLFLVPEAKWAEHLGGVAVQRRVGAPVDELTPDEAQTLVPFVTEGVYRCAYGPADGYIDPVAVLSTYLKLAGERGARLLLDAPVKTIRRLRGGWRLTTPQGSVTAPVIDLRDDPAPAPVISRITPHHTPAPPPEPLSAPASEEPAAAVEPDSAEPDTAAAAALPVIRHGQGGQPLDDRGPGHAGTAAKGRIGEPVPPTMRSGAMTKANSVNRCAAASSRARCSMMWMPLSTSSTRCTGRTLCPAPGGICS